MNVNYGKMIHVVWRAIELGCTRESVGEKGGARDPTEKMGDGSMDGRG